MIISTLPATSNREDWTGHFEVYDDDTGDPIDISDVDEITIAVRDASTEELVLSGSLTGGKINVVDDGVFEWTFSASQMGALSAKTYKVGCTIKQDAETAQLFIGNLPVLDGIVS